MKNLTLLLIAILAMSTSVMAETYPAYGPDSYKELRDSEEVTGVTRKGFRLGLGIGAANTYIDNYYLNNDNLSDTGFATTFEIGYAPNNQLSVNYLSNVNWAESKVNDYTGTISGVSGGGGFAVNYYFNNAINTPYIVGGVGASHLDGDDINFAGIVGIGYAMDKVEIELNGIFGTHYDESMSQVYFTVSYMFY